MQTNILKYTSMLLFLTCTQSVFAQWQYRDIITNDNITYPETSKHAAVSQMIGVTEIKVEYHRPGVKNRKVFGELEPYGKVWRAGANESTTIFFQDHVTINGKQLAPGKYSIHMIPGPNEWVVILSYDHTQWGSFYYDKSKDALRLNVKPQQSEFEEYLKYDFENLSPNAVSLVMHWDNVKVAFQIEVDPIATTLAIIRDELHTLPRFGWRGPREAAFFCWLNDTNLEEALDWVNLSIRYEERFDNLIIKAKILAALNKQKEATEVMKQAVAIGDENKMIFTAREALGHHNSSKKVIEILDVVLQYYPKSSEAYRVMAIAHGWLGDEEHAKESFAKAEKLATTDEQRGRIQQSKEGFTFFSK